jgi:hypothetical protein
MTFPAFFAALTKRPRKLDTLPKDRNPSGFRHEHAMRRLSLRHSRVKASEYTQAFPSKAISSRFRLEKSILCAPGVATLKTACFAFRSMVRPNLALISNMREESP